MQFLPMLIVSSTLNLSTVKYQSSLGLNSKAFLGPTVNESYLARCLRCIFILKQSYFLMLHFY